MKAAVWDVDGTLIDSYPVIGKYLYASLRSRKVKITYEEMMDGVKRHSVSWLLNELSDRNDLDKDEIDREYSLLSEKELDKIPLIEGAMTVLNDLQSSGVLNFVITHRGNSVYRIFDNLGITGCFVKIITREDGFARKPDPESMIHIIKAYGLKSDDLWYIGDRRLDIDFAHNSGVHPLLFSKDGLRDTDIVYAYQRVGSLYDIPKLILNFGK